MPDKVIAHTDGGSRGNPGPAAAGFVLTDPNGQVLAAKGFFLGKTTNNVAEYTAMVRALEAARKIGAKTIEVFSDSELMVRQLNGHYQVRSDLIRPLFDQAKVLLEGFDKPHIRHVLREKNKLADKVVNQALDAQQDIDRTPAQAPAGPVIRLGVLMSGGGRTLLNLLDCIRRGRIRGQVPLVISSRADVPGVERARNAGLAVRVVRRKDFPDIRLFSQSLEQELTSANVDLVVQGGWLCLWKIPNRFENRVMNIHPALLPSFGGQGMWGHNVHEAVLKTGCKVSGCTVHFCTDQYDNGPIILQRTCPVNEDDTPDTLAERVFREECIAYPEAIRLFADNRLTVQDGRVRIKPQT